ncbi:MAG TPA: alpha/beta hydrolase, partial [Acidimicrobiia bacterium]|nr:alpha/beta hydrolase [Acidimicrobiia bacterium]
GLAETHVGWIQGNFFGGEPGPTSGDVCEGAQGPLEHDHFFTTANAFGSHDENGEEVDHGDFEVVDEDTVSFPSHAAEFGYDGDLVVDYTVDGGVATFEVSLPEDCVDGCADAYAWALSAFASGPWKRGEVIAASTGTTTQTTAPSAEDPLTSPTIEGLYEIDDGGRRLNLTCWGEGSPTVVLEAGHPDGAGISDFGGRGAAFTRALAAETRVCAYGRAGWDGSDPAPNEPRTADDVIDDLHNLLGAAGVDGPYVMVGSSFGGMVVTYFAATYPEDVVGVVLLDVPAPDATLSVALIPEIAWDHPTNLEHLEIVPEFERRFANDPVSFPAPLAVLTATRGASDVEDQAIWLDASPDAHQIELDGGHEIYLDDPDSAASEVLALVRLQD